MQLEDITKRTRIEQTKKTKVVGYLMVAVAFLNFLIDLLDGNGIDFHRHFETIATALAGSGLVFLRSAIQKLE